MSRRDPRTAFEPLGMGAIRTVMVRLAAVQWRDAPGQALVEYALIVSVVALVATGALKLTGTNLTSLFSRIASAV